MKKLYTNESKRIEVLKDAFLKIIKEISNDFDNCGNAKVEKIYNADYVDFSRLIGRFEEGFAESDFHFNGRVEDKKFTKGIGNNSAYYIRDGQANQEEIIGSIAIINTMYGSANVFLIDTFTYEKLSPAFKISSRDITQL